MMERLSSGKIRCLRFRLSNTSPLTPGKSRNRKLTDSSVLSSLAQSIQKVFLFADGLGHLAHLYCAGLDSAVARTSAHEEVTDHATRQHDGAANPLRLDRCLSVACGRGSGMARMGARIHGL